MNKSFHHEFMNHDIHLMNLLLLLSAKNIELIHIVL